MHSDGGPRTNSTAVIALITAALGYFCLFGVGGVMGVVLGLVAKAEIKRSEPRERGGALATAAIALGLVQVAGFVVLAGMGIAMLARPPAPKAFAHPPVAPTALPAPSVARPSLPKSGELRGTIDATKRELEIGRLTLVDVGSDAGALGQVLKAEYAKALASKGRVVLFVVGTDCAPCNGVSLALGDPRMQQALAGSRVVRVHARERAEELTLLGVPIDTIPGFALLSATAQPTDYLHGGEWDADIPDNIAPVLTDFVRGVQRPRRYPWRGLRRPDETTL
jgi:hypothetical protein